MNKFSNIILGSILFTSIAFADEFNGIYFGIESGLFDSKTKGTIKHKNTSATQKVDDIVANFGLKIGYRFNQNHRIYGAYNYTTRADDLVTSLNGITIPSSILKVNSYKLLAGYDFTPKIFGNLRGVLGAYGGYANNDIKISLPIFSINDSENFQGFLYGAKAGVLFELGKSSEIELGAKVEKVELDKEKLIKLFNVSFNPSQTNYGLYLGYNYKF